MEEPKVVDVYSGHYLPAQQGHYTHECTMCFIACTRPAQDQANSHPSMDGRGSLKVPPRVTSVDGCWGGNMFPWNFHHYF